MAIQISGTTVINNDKELGSGLNSLYDEMTNTGISKTLVNREFCTVTSSGLTITLPASPSPGWEVVISVENFDNTIIGRNGQNIMGLAEDMVINAKYSTVNLVFVDATRGWRIS
jgi:hypothetical protein